MDGDVYVEWLRLNRIAANSAWKRKFRDAYRNGGLCALRAVKEGERARRKTFRSMVAEMEPKP